MSAERANRIAYPAFLRRKHLDPIFSGQSVLGQLDPLPSFVQTFIVLLMERKPEYLKFLRLLVKAFEACS
jgi:hypothetical protein